MAEEEVERREGNGENIYSLIKKKEEETYLSLKAKAACEVRVI